MTRVIFRKILADLRSHRLQFFLIFVILTAATTMFTITLVVQRGVDEPWERTFEETHGPHVWLSTTNSQVDLEPVITMDGVVETTGPILATYNHPLVIAGEKYDMFLYGMDQRPAVARPKVVKGRWLESAGENEIVLENGLARYFGFAVGDTTYILTEDGERPFTVVGMAVTAHFVPYTEQIADIGSGMAWVLPATLRAIEPDPTVRVNTIGLRLADPETSAEAIDAAHRLLNDQLYSSIDWQWVRDMVSAAIQLYVLFLGLFSLIGLVAVGFIIANTIGGSVLAEYRDIGLLKAVGFKPNQVLLIFLVEHLAISIPATLVGLGLGAIGSPAFTSPVAEALNIAPPSVNEPGLLLTVILFINGAVLFFALLPAWHGSRINTVQAITVGFAQRHARSSRLAQWGRWLRLPPVIVLGMKDAFTRRLRATLTIIGLMLTVFVIIFAVGSQASIDNLSKNSTYFQGTPADWRVDRGFVPADEAEALLSAQPAITAYYTEADVYGWAAGSTEPLLFRALGGDYARFDFDVVEGRMIEGPGEIVVAYGALTLLDLKVGDPISLIIDGKSLELTIVGRYREIFNMGRTALYDIRTHRQYIDPAVEPQHYGVALAPGTDTEVLTQTLMRASNDQFDIMVADGTANASVLQLRDVLISLGVLLTAIAAVNLLSTSLLSVRERVRDFGIQKALGLTPAQIALSVTTEIAVWAIIALLVGIPLGLYFYDGFVTQIGKDTGIGPELSYIDWRLMAIVLPGTVILALLSSALPARWAAQIRVAEALQYE